MIVTILNKLQDYFFSTYDIHADKILTFFESADNGTKCLQILSMAFALVSISISISNIFLQKRSETPLGLSLDELGITKKINRRSFILKVILILLAILSFLDCLFTEFSFTNKFYVGILNISSITLLMIILLVVLSLLGILPKIQKEKLIANISDKMLKKIRINDSKLSFNEKYKRKYPYFIQVLERYIANQNTMSETLITFYNVSLQIIVSRKFFKKKKLQQSDIFQIGYIITSYFCDFKNLHTHNRINNYNFINEFLLHCESEYLKYSGKVIQQKDIELFMLGIITAFFTTTSSEKNSNIENYFRHCFRSNIENNSSGVKSLHKKIIGYLTILSEYWLRIGYKKSDIFYYFDKYHFYWNQIDICSFIKNLLESPQKSDKVVSSLVFQNWESIFKNSGSLIESLFYLQSNMGKKSYIQILFSTR